MPRGLYSLRSEIITRRPLRSPALSRVRTAARRSRQPPYARRDRPPTLPFLVRSTCRNRSAPPVARMNPFSFQAQTTIASPASGLPRTRGLLVPFLLDGYAVGQCSSFPRTGLFTLPAHSHAVAGRSSSLTDSTNSDNCDVLGYRPHRKRPDSRRAFRGSFGTFPRKVRALVLNGPTSLVPSASPFATTPDRPP